MTGAKAVVIAPHSDDECLGVGGSIALLADAGAEVMVVAVGSELPPLYAPGVAAAVHEEARAAHKVLGVTESVFLDIPSVEIPDIPKAELNGRIQEVVDGIGPTIAFIPFPDRHVDHKAVFDAAMVATRPVRRGVGISMVALYEVISETYFNAPGADPTFAPSWTVDVSASIDRKIEAYECYQSRVTTHPGPRSPEALRALAVFRGSQSGFAYGEAFQVARSSFAPSALFG